MIKRKTLIKLIHQKTGLSREKVEQALEAMESSICDLLAQGESLQFSKLGTFEVRQRAPRLGRNPKTGAPVNVPSRRVPIFRPSEYLKGIVGLLKEEEDES